MTQPFRIDLMICEETGVLVATSEDIPGLVLEAETFGGIMDALIECAPELIRQNLPAPPEDEYRFSFAPVQHPVLRSCTTALARAA